MTNRLCDGSAPAITLTFARSAEWALGGFDPFATPSANDRSLAQRTSLCVLKCATFLGALLACCWKAFRITSHPADQIRGAFGDHDRGRVGVAAHDARHHRGVDDAKAVEPMHLELAVDHRPDRAGAGRVIDGLGFLLDMLPDVGFGR